MDTGGSLRWVSPFRHLRIVAHLQLPAAFRSLSRLSSALSAKASTLCSFLLNLSDIGLSFPSPPSVAVLGFFPDLSGYFFLALQIYLLYILPMYSSDVLYISFANLIFKINFQYSVFKVQPCPHRADEPSRDSLTEYLSAIRKQNFSPFLLSDHW